MIESRTPDEWKSSSFLYGCIVGTDKYNNETEKYSEVPNAELNVLWQPVSDETTIAEYGARTSELLQAVVYGATPISKRDKVAIGSQKYRVESIKTFPSYRLVTIERIR